MSTNPTTTRPKPRKHLTELRTRRDEAKTSYVISADAEIPGTRSKGRQDFGAKRSH